MQDKIGKLIEQGEQRDAIHIAVAPVIAKVVLAPGARIGFVEESTELVTNDTKNPIGIVDPFLMKPVQVGKRFWMFLFPNTVTSLRHEWTHPAFPSDTSIKEQSEQWLRRYACKLNPYTLEDKGEEAAYQLMMSYIADGIVYAHGADLHGLYELDDAEEFFGHLAVVLGKPVDRENLTYSCSC
jgi:hypothetical protein